MIGPYEIPFLKESEFVGLYLTTREKSNISVIIPISFENEINQIPMGVKIIRRIKDAQSL